MDRVAVDPDAWARLITCASGLPRTVQASLDKLALLMSPSGSVRHALAQLMLITARSRSTVSDHLGTAQATGWLTCVQRGGYRSQGAQPSTYQATVPLQVWERRAEILSVFAEQNQDQAELPAFPLGSVIAVQSASGASSGFSSTKINPSLIIKKSVDSTPSQQAAAGDEESSETDPVIAAVIEELAACTGRMVSPSWAARCVSQIMRHRTVRHPVAYVVKTLQNAAQDGTLTDRFMPSEPDRTAPGTEEDISPSQTPDVQLSPRATELLGDAPWDDLGSESLSGQEAPDAPWKSASTQQTGVSPVTTLAEEVKDAHLKDSPQEIYQPGGRVLAGLGRTGALELVKLRKQFAQRRSTHEEGTRGLAGAAVLSTCP